ncbi:hypothetical protein DS2_06121 [Catenovulum agarivorans DS-2]|uniref:Chromate transporter n=1 Tax=Catenovulum agarivorans DS-2 TaxID=1328313 RepID=W7QD69_9ALTE|nr:chromate efflux transporter [Catenovulum agarivorans]EWH10844.1 hypothetical protein DS2_06121 [Catenovulum agarivorans DS-2]
MKELFSLFLTFFRLGCVAFGGPAAHLALFKQTFVDEKQWLSADNYAQIMAISQFMPGPASSQVGICLGMLRAGQLGGFVAWLGFTLPTALLLVCAAYGLTQWQNDQLPAMITGLKLATAAIVLHACYSMSRQFCTSALGWMLLILSTSTMILFNHFAVQFLIIATAALCSVLFAQPLEKNTSRVQLGLSPSLAWISFAMLLVLLVCLPLFAQASEHPLLLLFDSFFRIGATVFGGGHVVLPMLENEVVANKWVTLDDFLAGYGITQAMPGPIFTFAAFLGGVNQLGLPMAATAALCLIAIFLPSFLLINCCFYFWQKISNNTQVQKALVGINASVVGFLLAAFYDPILTSAINEHWQVALVLLLTLVLHKKWAPAWLLVVASGLLAVIFI